MSLTPYTPQGLDLEQWATDAAQVHKMAQAIANTSFVPKNMQNRPDEITAQIMYGREVDLSPMVALQQIHVIDGRPSMSALSMRGKAQSAGVKFRLDESSETRCKYSAMAPGDADWTTVVWTMDRAKKLGVTTKTNWQKQPQAMLIARATSELCRLVAAPLFLGLSYSTEELRDGASDVERLVPEGTANPYSAPKYADPKPEPAPEPETRTVRRAPVKATATVDPPADDQPAKQIEPAPISDKYRKALMAAFRDANITLRESRLSYVSGVLARTVGSVNDITDSEAVRILTRLHIDFPEQAMHADEYAPEPEPS